MEAPGGDMDFVQILKTYGKDREADAPISVDRRIPCGPLIGFVRPRPAP